MYVYQISLLSKQGVMDVSLQVALRNVLVVKLYGIVEAHVRYGLILYNYMIIDMIVFEGLKFSGSNILS